MDWVWVRTIWRDSSTMAVRIVFPSTAPALSNDLIGRGAKNTIEQEKPLLIDWKTAGHVHRLRRIYIRSYVWSWQGGYERATHPVLLFLYAPCTPPPPSCLEDLIIWGGSRVGCGRTDEERAKPSALGGFLLLLTCREWEREREKKKS